MKAMFTAGLAIVAIAIAAFFVLNELVPLSTAEFTAADEAVRLSNE